MLNRRGATCAPSSRRMIDPGGFKTWTWEIRPRAGGAVLLRRLAVKYRLATREEPHEPILRESFAGACKIGRGSYHFRLSRHRGTGRGGEARDRKLHDSIGRSRYRALYPQQASGEGHEFFG